MAKKAQLIGDFLLFVVQRDKELVLPLLQRDQNYTPKPTEGVGPEICQFVYFHRIVFCLDFHRGGGNWISENEEGNRMKTKEAERSPV